MKVEWEPVPWAESPTPPHAAACELCALSRQRKRVIWGEGNPEARIMVLLDNPGEREDKEGNPYVCGTRQTLQRAAREAGFAERDLYVTYVLKCRPVRAYDKEGARSACFGHLTSQLEAGRPELVFCLGNVAVQTFFQDAEAEVKALRGKCHDVRGYRTVVSYHPLAVRRRPNLLRLFQEDWRLAASLAKY